MDKYKPRSFVDLAVHKKKVELIGFVLQILICDHKLDPSSFSISVFVIAGRRS